MKTTPQTIEFTIKVLEDLIEDCEPDDPGEYDSTVWQHAVRDRLLNLEAVLETMTGEPRGSKRE